MRTPEAASKPVEDARGTRAPSHGSSPSPPPDGGSEGGPAATSEETAQHRTVHLSVRLFPEELERIRFAARGRGLATSTFVRAASLGESLPEVRSGQEKRDVAALLVRVLPVLEALAARLEGEGYAEATRELGEVSGLLREALGRLLA